MKMENCILLRENVKKIEECYHVMLGSDPKQIYMSPLERGDHHVLDASKHLDQDGMQKHLSFVGATQ